MYHFINYFVLLMLGLPCKQQVGQYELFLEEQQPDLEEQQPDFETH